MDNKLLIVGLFIFTLFAISLANKTDTNESNHVSNEDEPTEIPTTLSPTETSHQMSTANITIEPSLLVTKGSQRKMKQERSRRQGYVYVSSQANYGVTTLFDLCPPVATTCPICTNEGVQVPYGFCNSVVLKVVALSPPQMDGNGRVCGKFGMLKLYGDFDEKAFRRLLRFSVPQNCGCAVKASGAYFFISPLSSFLKDGLRFNQIVLTEQAVLITADRYIENEILEVLNNCPESGYDPGVSEPYIPSPVPPIPVIQPSATPDVPPPIIPFTPYVTPPTKPPVVYTLPPVLPPTSNPPPVLPPGPYNPPSEVGLVSTMIPSSQLQPYRDKIPFLYPSMTRCIIPETCPACERLDNAGDITDKYCAAGFAHLGVIRVPDFSSLQDSPYLGTTCMNLRTNIVYDITRTRDPNIMVSALTALLPSNCKSCFAGLRGPVIVLIMGKEPPVPPIVQLDASFRIYILPVPATVVLPSCGIYSMYGTFAVPYSLLPVAPQPYVTNDCSVAADQTCPLCQNYPNALLAHACAYGFALITELNLAGPYFTSQRLPAISVKTTTTYYSKSVEVIITNPPPIDCIKGFFKIIQNIGHAPLNFPGEIIPFVSLPTCECLSLGLKRMLIFSSGPLTISQEGVLHLTKDINIAFLPPEAALPTCGVQPPPSSAYVTSQPFFIPQPQIPLAPYARTARVPLTYIPPPPPSASYIPPSVPSPGFLLPPDYIPPPAKESARPSPPAPYATIPSFEEPPPVIGCIGDGSCVVVDENPDKETHFAVNVNEDIPYSPQFTLNFNSVIYEESSVWSPSFKECLDSVQPSCPHNLEESYEKFEEFFCKAKTALLVAVGVDYRILGNETAVTKKITFLQPELPYIGINYDNPKNPVSLNVAITQNKTMDRKVQLQDNANYCYTERVFVLSDLSNVLKPRGVVGTLDIFTPGSCDSEIFDKIPSYGILLSTLQPSDVKNPVQLTEEFAFIPLLEGKLDLPDCGKLLEQKPYADQVQSTKFWVPKSPMESVICELSEEDNCKGWRTADDESVVVPCDVKSAALVVIQKTSAGNSVGPNIEILETSYESGEKVVTLSVLSNIDDEDIYPNQRTQYPDHFNRCKYATVRILKDLSQRPLINEDDVLTIIANTNCDSPIFKLTNQVVLLLSDDPIYPNTIIPLEGDRAEVIGIPPGTTTISFCNAHQPEDTFEEMPFSDVKPLLNESIAFIDHVILDDSINETSSAHDKTPDTYEVPSNVESLEELEVSCQGHIDDSCPVCEDFASISSDVYCNSGLSLVAEVIEQKQGEESCINGVIASLYEITGRNTIPESKPLKISYTIPSHCSCSALKEGENLILLLDESNPVGDELSITLSEGKYLYTTPLQTTFPSCYMEDSVQARSKNVDNVIVLNSPYKELLKIMPELSGTVCPSFDHTCPQCRNMDDKELENLYCTSEEVLLVSRNKKQKEYPRKFSRIGKATFTQHKVASNYSLEMSIDKYESPCGLPLAAGNCDQSLDRFYFNVEEEACTNFTYTGCGGNANNFVSEEQCENNCFVESFCEEGILDIKKIMKTKDNADYLDNKFHYTLPEHCNCSEMLKGDKEGYLMSVKVDNFSLSSIQLSRNYYFVPLSKNQRKKQFSCTSNGKTTNSNGKSAKHGETTNSDFQTGAASVYKKKKKQSAFPFFG